MKRLLLICLVSVLGLLILISPVEAVGIKVKPQQIDLSGQAGQAVQTEMLVINVGQEPALYKLYPDELSKYIIIEPKEFQLEPGASRLVTIRTKANLPTKLATNISVVGRSLKAGGLAAASGIKVPITIQIYGLPIWLWSILIIVGFLFMLVVIKLKQIKFSKVQFGPKL